MAIIAGLVPWVTAADGSHIATSRTSATRIRVDGVASEVFRRPSRRCARTERDQWFILMAYLRCGRNSAMSSAPSNRRNLAPPTPTAKLPCVHSRSRNTTKVTTRDFRFPEFTRTPPPAAGLATMRGVFLWSDRRDNPFRVPWPYEFRTIDDVREFLIMCSAAFLEPYVFSQRVSTRRCGTAAVSSTSCTTTSASAPACSVCARRLAVREHAAPPDHRRPREISTSRTRAARWRRMTLRRWYGFLRMQMKVACEVPRHITVSENSKEGHRRGDGRRHQHAQRRAGRCRPGAIPPDPSHRRASRPHVDDRER